MSPDLLLASVAEPTRQRMFDRIVIEGIDPEQYLLSVPTDGHERVVHLLPLPESAGIGDVDSLTGDFVLFYQGGNEYSWAAKVIDVERNESIIADILGDAGIDRADRAEFSDQFLILDVPVPIQIQSYDLHEAIGLDQETLTRFVYVTGDRLEPISRDYGSLIEYILSFRKEPTVWIEKTRLEDRPYKQEGGEYELGTAVFSRSEASDGSKIYETLREAAVGDIVLHLLQDQRKIAGVSLITSTLREDFEGPPDDSWPDDARGSGYFRALARYHPLDAPIDIYDDILDNPDYHARLQEIYEEYDGLVYDKNRSLIQGAYFRRCPLELLYLFLAEAPDLLETLRDRYYEVPFPASADTYTSVNETLVDVRIRLAFTDEGVGWFREQLTATVITSLTETLKKIQPNAELTRKEAVHCELIATTYEMTEDRLEYLADDLGIGRANQVSSSRVLFFVLFRELQNWAGVSTNMNHVKVSTILNENYTVETPRPQLVDPDEVEPLSEPEKPADADDIERLLRDSGQVVFYGPPGTGKTYVAQQFAKWWLHQQPDIEPDSSHLTTVTFHPSFTYEDFLEGLSAEVTEENTVAYEHTPGVFKEIADRARLAYQDTSPDENAPRYVLIIDEINRGNLAQIFGETMTALEYDKRLDQPNETVVSLAHTGTPFTIPPNLYLIGTMNTADRSIALVDTALRRRFRFFSFPPTFQVLYRDHRFPFDSQAALESAAADGSNPDQRLLALSVLAVQHFNEQIIDTADLGKGKQIGHSFFFGVEDSEDVVDLWRFEFLPLLEEYFFGQFDRMQDILFAGGGAQLLDYDREEIKDFDQATLESTLAQLVERISGPES